MDTPGNNSSPLRLILVLFFILVVPLAAGLFLAPRLVPAPKIGVIRLNYDILDQTAFEFREQMTYALEDKSVRAVVIIINSPGGSAAYSEELYLEVLEARRDMPVLASVDLLAASGAYYVAAAANEIYAKPTSNVGSIGVLGVLPGPVFVDEQLLSTGPFKAFGLTQDAAVRQAERAKFAFLQAIETGRGDALQVATDVLARAEIYTGIQALEMGLVDGMRSTGEVYDRAAELAGLNDYEIVELYPLAFGGDGDEASAAYRPAPIDRQRLWAMPDDPPPGLYYRYVELPTYR